MFPSCGVTLGISTLQVHCILLLCILMSLGERAHLTNCGQQDVVREHVHGSQALANRIASRETVSGVLHPLHKTRQGLSLED